MIARKARVRSDVRGRRQNRLPYYAQRSPQVFRLSQRRMPDVWRSTNYSTISVVFSRLNAHMFSCCCAQIGPGPAAHSTQPIVEWLVVIRRWTAKCIAAHWPNWCSRWASHRTNCRWRTWHYVHNLRVYPCRSCGASHYSETGMYTLCPNQTTAEVNGLSIFPHVAFWRPTPVWSYVIK